jgi:carbon storage regulator CsrA
MLVLTRKYQEKVRIGDGITITILRAKGKTVRLGIEAPPEVPVIRGELSFDREPVSAAVEDTDYRASDAPIGDSSTRREDGRPKKVHSVQEWATESHRKTNGRRRAPQATPGVSLHRVPRDKATEILPQLLSSGGPLRQMLNERTRAV